MHFQSTVKKHDFLSLQRLYWVVSRLWTRFNYSDWQRSRPRIKNKFSSNFFGSLEVFAVSKKRFFEQSSIASSNYPRPVTDYGDGRRSALKCRCTRYGHKRVSGAWSGRFWILLGKRSVGCRRCLLTRHWYPFSPTAFDDLEMRFSRKPHSARRKRGQEELSSNDTNLWETNTTPCIAEKSSISNKNRNCSLLCL